MADLDVIEETDPERAARKQDDRKVVGVRIDRSFWQTVKTHARGAVLTVEEYVKAALEEKMSRDSQPQQA